MCLIDVEKVFDRIRVSEVFKILQEQGVPIDITKDIYTNISLRVKANDKLSGNIPVTTRVRAGGFPKSHTLQCLSLIHI